MASKKFFRIMLEEENENKRPSVLEFFICFLRMVLLRRRYRIDSKVKWFENLEAVSRDIKRVLGFFNPRFELI